MNKYEKVEQMDAEEKADLIFEYLGVDDIFNTLIDLIGLWDMEEHLDHIIRMYDLVDMLEDDEEE